MVGSIVRSCCRFRAALLSRCCFGGTSGTADALSMNRCSAARSAAFFESDSAVTARRVALRLRANAPLGLCARASELLVSPPLSTALRKKSSCSAIGTSSWKHRVTPAPLNLRRFCAGGEWTTSGAAIRGPAVAAALCLPASWDVMSRDSRSAFSRNPTGSLRHRRQCTWVSDRCAERSPV